MRTPGHDLDKLIVSVKHQYDELDAKMHLANGVVRQEWAEMQALWQTFCEDYDRILRGDYDSRQQQAALRLTAEEYRDAFNQISDAFETTS